MSQRPWLTAAVRRQLGLNGGGCRVSSGGGGGLLLLFGTSKMGDWGGTWIWWPGRNMGAADIPGVSSQRKKMGGNKFHTHIYPDLM